MLVNTTWLLDYLTPQCSHADLLNAFTAAGLEVEEEYHLAEDLRPVVVGFVRKKTAIAGAEGLFHTQIEIAKNRVIDVVCASEHEVREGWGVPVAPAGTVLPSGATIQAGTYHGVNSEGMICLDGELGLVSRTTGLQVFDDETLLGKPLTEVSETEELLVDLAILPNRPDCLGMIGVAREMAAVLGLRLKYPVEPERHLSLSDKSVVPVHIEDGELCPRYLGQAIRGVKVGPSPHWLKSRLLLSGKRPINNVVDITNFVLLEWGQPLHAFDLATLKGPEIRVRNMRPGETLTLLDETELKQSEPPPLVIADAERPVALAGIMGGSETQTRRDTTDVLLEAACFNSVNIRGTSKRLGVRTDSSYRFERGTDPNRMLLGAATRAAELICELAGGKLDGDCTEQYPNKREPATFQLSAEHFSRYLGMEVDAKTIRENLEKLEMTCDDDLNVQAPTWRMDANDKVALIEDVARLVGYDAIPLKPASAAATSGHTHPLDRLRSHVAEALTANGFLETRTPPLRPVDDAGQFTANGKPIRLQNPMRTDMTELRRSLIPSLIEVVERNHRRGAESFRFYEIDRTFTAAEPEPIETWTAGIILGGPARELSWRDAGENVDFYHLKGVVDSILETLGTRDAVYSPATRNGFVGGKTATITAGGETLGIIGQIDPSLTAKSKLRTPVFAAELNLHALLPHFTEIRLHGGLPRTQAVEKDLSVIVPMETPYGKLVATIRETFEQSSSGIHAAFLKSADEEQQAAAQGPRLEEVRCVDTYRGQGIAEDRKSLTIRMTFRDVGRTLTSEESNALLQAVADSLAKSHDAELRG